MENSTKQIETLLRAKVQCIWIRTFEEVQVIKTLKNIINEFYPKAKLMTWTYFNGLQEEPLAKGKAKEKAKNLSPDKLLSMIDADEQKGGINNPSEAPCENFWVLKDFHLNISQPSIIRGIRDVKEKNANEIKGYNPIIIISPTLDIPMEHEKLFEFVDFEIPSKEEVQKIIKDFYVKVSSKGKYDKTSDEELKACIDFAYGLTYSEIKKLQKISLVKYNKLSSKIFKEARINLVKKTGILNYKETTASLDEIGGNNVFKAWVRDLKNTFSKEAEEFGVSKPKGYLSVGLPGTSKSVAAECVANTLGLPLIEFKISSIMHSHVGQSEKNMESALKVAQACSPCVLFIDEVEKALGGM